MRKVPLSDFPALAAEFDSERNGKGAAEVGKTDRTSYWWLCSVCGESWQASAVNRLKNFGRCPGCESKLPFEKSLAGGCPEVAKCWTPSLNNGRTSDSVAVSEWNQLPKWNTCSEPGHVYEMSTGEKVRSFRRYGTDPHSCPLCLNRMVVPGVNDLETTHPQLAQELIAGGNPAIAAKNLSSGAKDTYFWLCPMGHRYAKPVHKRAIYGENCPYCSGKRVLAGYNDLATLRPDIAAAWHLSANLPVKPEEVFPWSNRKFFWVCDKLHEYQATVAHRSEGKSCPYCVNKKLLSGFNDLGTVRPDLAAEFDESRNGLGADQLLAGSFRAFWWRCSEGHGWKQKPAVRLQGKNCPDCAELGFHPNRPAQLYFIVHDDWRAGKVGITNIDANEIRLKRHAALGWRLVWELKDDSGKKVRNLETRALRWIRNELQLPQFVGSQEMSATGGWTETFSMGDLSEEEVVVQIKKLWTEIT